MSGMLILCVAVLAGAPDSGPAELEAYRAAASKAGRDAGAHVDLALWCERHGLDAERLKHLALAAVLDPANATARGLLGLVHDGDAWRRPEAVAERVRSDPELAAARAEYEARRSKTPYRADEQWKLALWCERHGLKAEATAHLAAVVRLEPGRDLAWKHLGYKKQNGRWMTDEEASRARAEAEAQEKADRQWRKRLAQYKEWLGKSSRRAEAERALAAVTDPRAVPAVVRAFAFGKGEDQRRAVQILGQIDAPAAARTLAALAVFGADEAVRRAAVETLRRRDPRDVLDWLIARLAKPIKYEVKPVGGPGTPGVLFVEGRRFNERRVYAPPVPNIQIMPGDQLTYDAYGLPVIIRSAGFINSNRPLEPARQDAQSELAAARGLSQRLSGDFGAAGIPGGPQTAFALLNAASGGQLTADQQIANLPKDHRVPEGGRMTTTIHQTMPIGVEIPVGRMMLEARRSAVAAERQLEADVAMLKQYNAELAASNDRTAGILRGITGQDFGDDQEAWRKWWTDQQGYAYRQQPESPRPTLTEEVPLVYQPAPVPVGLISGPVSTSVTTLIHHSCFAAGTMVRTRAGLRPIEEIRAGDVILAQDTRTGALSFEPVLVAYHNPPNATYKVRLGDESIVATGIHRFWKAGAGWTMARDLKPGDVLRTVAGTAAVVAVEPDAVQPVFNLEVARGHDFFVGGLGALVHDNSRVAPAVEPFDAPPALAAVGD